MVTGEISVDRTGFDAVWAVADQIPGWLTRDQAVMLWQATMRLAPGSHVVEIGSHQGRSTIVLASAARLVGARVTAIDPFVEGRLFGGAATRDRFEANIAHAGLTDTVTLLPERSTRLRPTWTEQVDLLYIDGKHDFWTVSDDLRWCAAMPAGAEVLVHDCFSSIGVTTGVLATMLTGGRYTYLGRTASMAQFRLRRPGWADRARILRQLPWFIRNVCIKVLLRLRLRLLAGALGHVGQADPY
jgi:hypothetical protein